MAFTKATYDYLDSGGLINWQLTAKTSAFTAVSGEGYLVDTSSAAVTVTLPASPSAGDEIIIVDYASNAGTNNITLDPGTLNLRGATDDLVLDNDNQTARLLYSGATKGWLVTTEAGAGTAAAALPDLTVDYLVVAGGGGGGKFGGGGGAGGLITSYTNSSSLNGHNQSAVTLSANTNYDVSVGPGGAAATAYNVTGSNGDNSEFYTITSTGGGGGGSYNGLNGSTGGSGGGGGMSETSYATGAAAVTSPFIQGYAGSNSSPVQSGYSGGGGGGGAAAAAINASGQVGADGGNGLAVNIINTANATTESVGEVSGSAVFFAGGGSGQGTASGGSGGTGGGGNGGKTNNTVNPDNGTPNTGGGGGSGNNTIGSGGSGVVILRYPSDYTISETTSGGNVLTFNTYTEGSDYVTVFTSGQSGTIQFST